MRLLEVPPRQGIAWMRQGFSVFMRQPMGWSMVFASFLFAMVLLMLVPMVGPVLLLVLLPLATLAFMVATRSTLAGTRVTPAVFVQPLRQRGGRTAALLKLGVTYAVATAAAVAISGWVDGGAFETAVDSATQGEGSGGDVAGGLVEPGAELGLLLRLALASVLSIPFWHAPALVHWGGQGPAQALFSSTLAIWRNRGAFTVYGLAWTGVVVGFGVVVALGFGLIGQPRLAVFALMPATLLFSTAFYASLWFTFADCFGSDTSDEAHSHPITTDTP